MTFNDRIFKAFNDFGIDDMLAQADISRACSGDFETQPIELKRQLGAK